MDLKYKIWKAYHDIKLWISGIGLTKEQKNDLNRFIDYAVGEGYLDEYEAIAMTYKDMQNYLDWSDYMANSYVKGE